MEIFVRIVMFTKKKMCGKENLADIFLDILLIFVFLPNSVDVD